jgi:hypothetical protein
MNADMIDTIRICILVAAFSLTFLFLLDFFRLLVRRLLHWLAPNKVVELTVHEPNGSIVKKTFETSNASDLIREILKETKYKQNQALKELSNDQN